MPPVQAPDLKTLTADQVKLLTAYIDVSPQLKAHQWTDIARKLGIGNGKAAKERFRYLANSLNTFPPKRSKAASISQATTTAGQKRSVPRQFGGNAAATPGKKAKVEQDSEPAIAAHAEFEGEEEEEEEEEEKEEREDDNKDAKFTLRPASRRPYPVDAAATFLGFDHVANITSNVSGALFGTGMMTPTAFGGGLGDGMDAGMDMAPALGEMPLQLSEADLSFFNEADSSGRYVI